MICQTKIQGVDAAAALQAVGADSFKVRTIHGNKTVTDLQIPVTSTLQAFINAKDWVDKAISISSGSQEGEDGLHPVLIKYHS